VYGHIKGGSLDGVPIAACLGDQQSALVGHAALTPGEGKVTYGTGAFMLLNTGTEPVQSKNGLLTTVGYQLGPKSQVK
jgi:glycerol kinase